MSDFAVDLTRARDERTPRMALRRHRDGSMDDVGEEPVDWTDLDGGRA